MADLVKYPAEVLQAVYKTHRHADLDKVVSRTEQGQRRFYGEDIVLAVTLDLWDRDGRRIRLYQQERQVLRAIYVLAHRQNSIIVEFTPAQLTEVPGYAKVNGNDFSPTQRQQVLRALNNLFQIHAEVEMKLGSGGTKKIYGHFLDSYAVYTDQGGKIRKYAVQVNVLIGLDLSRFKLMPADLPKLITRHGPDQAVTTFADFCLLWEGQTVDWGLDTWVERLQLDPTRRTRNMQIIDRCARWGMDHGLVLSWRKSRMRQDKRKVKYTMTIAPQRYRGKSPGIEDGREGCRGPVERFYELLGAKASERKLAQDMAVAGTLLAEGFCPEDLTFAVEWAMAHIPSVKSFGLIPYIMHQALKARDDVQHAEEAQREAEARIDEQLNRERYVDLCRTRGYFTPAFYRKATPHMERIHVRRMLRQVTDGRGWPVLANIVRADPDGRPERVFMQEELFGPEEYRQVVAYHYRMARHHLFKAQTYREHAKARFGVQLPLFDEDGDEGDGEAAT